MPRGSLKGLYRPIRLPLRSMAMRPKTERRLPIFVKFIQIRLKIALPICFTLYQRQFLKMRRQKVDLVLLSQPEIEIIIISCCKMGIANSETSDVALFSRTPYGTYRETTHTGQDAAPKARIRPSLVGARRSLRRSLKLSLGISLEGGDIRWSRAGAPGGGSQKLLEIGERRADFQALATRLNGAPPLRTDRAMLLGGREGVRCP